MTQRATELWNAILQLSQSERFDLYDKLEEHLFPPDRDIDNMSEEEFAAELERRHQEILQDPNMAIPWEEVRRKSEEWLKRGAPPTK